MRLTRSKTTQTKDQTKLDDCTWTKIRQDRTSTPCQIRILRLTRMHNHSQVRHNQRLRLMQLRDQLMSQWMPWIQWTSLMETKTIRMRDHKPSLLSSASWNKRTVSWAKRSVLTRACFYLTAWATPIRIAWPIWDRTIDQTCWWTVCSMSRSVDYALLKKATLNGTHKVSITICIDWMRLTHQRQDSWVNHWC